MSAPERIDLDAVIFGGGVAGLWTLDVLVRSGRRVLLLEASALGSGQTIAAQGIIHGGLKYTLDGVPSESARAIATMPALWRECLSGERLPHLGGTTLRADWCVLWRTAGLRSRFGMAAARKVLQVQPVVLDPGARPAVLRDSKGEVDRLDEPVIDPASLLADLAQRHRDLILKYDFENGIDFTMHNGQLSAIRLHDAARKVELDLRPRAVVLTAGEGNGALRARIGLDAGTMQVRPLHMAMVRGASLPTLNGHCTDGARTRVTVTSSVDRSGRQVWQVGGQLAEDGVALEPAALIERARSEMTAVLPELPRTGLEWSTYRVNRAERASGGKRPSDVWCEREGNVITGWPTKLALAPRLADRIASLLDAPDTTRTAPETLPIDWPHLAVAVQPWERDGAWIADR